MKTQAIRNLLTGLLAYQAGLVSREQLVTAIRVWVDNKEREVGEILREQKAIGTEVQELLVALAAKQVQSHEGEPEKSLNALTSISDSLVQSLNEIDDVDLNQTLALAATLPTGSAPGRDHSTATSQQSSSPSVARFSVIRPHAKGGLGEVFVAYDHELNRQVALKEIQGKYSFDDDSRLRFMQEAEITGGLEHPGIVPVYGLGTYADGRPFYAMRFIKGVSLGEAASKFHSKDSPSKAGDYLGIEFRQLLRRFVDVCFSIEYAHARGVLHRDLKPGNIMLGKYGETLVVDWGLAKPMHRTAESEATNSGEETLRPASGDSANTRMGQALGTPAYMSPEAAAGRLEELGVASDVYCLGATLYHLLTGSAPYGRKGSDTLEAVKLGKFPPPRETNTGIPRALEAICLKAMQHVPAQRYASAKLLAEEVELWLAGEPVSAYAEPLSTRISRFARRHKTIVSSVAIAGTLTLVGAIGYSSLLAKKNQQLLAANEQIIAQEVLAQQNAKTARDVALNITEIAEGKLSSFQGQEGFREDLMDRAYALFSQSHSQQPDDTQIAWELARVSRLHGNLKIYLKKRDEARLLLEESLQLQTRLNRSDKKSRDYLAETYRDYGSWGKSSGNLESAADSFAKASVILDELLADAPDDENLLRTSASIEMERVGLYLNLLNHDAALASATRCEETYVAFASSPSARDLDYVVAMLASSRKGQALALLGRLDEARSVYEAAIERGRTWLERSASVDLRYAFARTLLYFGTDLTKQTTIPDDAETLIDEATSRFQILVDTRKSDTYRYYVACADRTQAIIAHSQGDLESATEKLEKSIAAFDAIVANTPSANYHAALAEALITKVSFLKSANDVQQAKLACEQAVEHQRQSVALNPDGLLGRQDLIDYERQLAAF
jgi:eukaryotic-like serine/threonine-protein kinase